MLALATKSLKKLVDLIKQKIVICTDDWVHFSYWDETIKTALIRPNIYMILSNGME